MRKFFVIFLFLYSLSGIAQDNNFIVEKDKLVWENVFISTETNIPNIVGRHSRLKIISSEGLVYKGKAVELRNTCPGSSNLLKNDYSYDFEIELKEGKYRVTVSNIVFYKKVKKQKVVSTAESNFIENAKLKQDATTLADLTCIENYIVKLFSPIMAYKSKS
ncbi:hypothetical protein GR160_00825 [Flavobacterium sp. Sd200]|uniref:hypothetical protein n=1 Tax=Flavobacterium sp. Sd200 TaxID=2692211 RepID=UPI00136D615E|nr:hypothetical protein [Flavobacterium sp. Sd200]MXN89758.1 hypothetical protein [Flavobacterium sp. Sd200]